MVITNSGALTLPPEVVHSVGVSHEKAHATASVTEAGRHMWSRDRSVDLQAGHVTSHMIKCHAHAEAVT